MFATTNRRKSRPEAILLSFLVLASVLCAGRSADAAAMKTLHARSQQARTSALTRYTHAEQALNNYYAQVLATHSLHVFVPPVLRNIQLDNGLLHQSSFVAYLQWRRSLAPARFDFYHPIFTSAIITDQQIRQSLVTTPTVTPSSLNPSPGGVTPPTDNVIPPIATPEPSSLLIAGLMIAAGFWVKWRSGQ